MSVSFDHLKQFITAELAHRKAQPAGVLSPSDYWLDYNRFSSYVRTLPDAELALIRHHTWHLTGDIYSAYHFISRRAKREVIAEYEAFLPRLGGFRPVEPPGGIGVETPHGLLNSGILRYAVVVGGQAQQLNTALASLGQALVLAVILEYMLLVALYQSWFYPMVRMMAVPLGLVGSLVGLLVTQNTLNIFSIIGLIMAEGLVAKSSRSEEHTSELQSH